MDFLAIYLHVLGRRDPDADPIPLDCDDGDLDGAVDHDCFAHVP
jgi:hypothetical protein